MQHILNIGGSHDTCRHCKVLCLSPERPWYEDEVHSSFRRNLGGNKKHANPESKTPADLPPSMTKSLAPFTIARISTSTLALSLPIGNRLHLDPETMHQLVLRTDAVPALHAISVANRDGAVQREGCCLRHSYQVPLPSSSSSKDALNPIIDNFFTSLHLIAVASWFK